MTNGSEDPTLIGLPDELEDAIADILFRGQDIAAQFAALITRHPEHRAAIEHRSRQFDDSGMPEQVAGYRIHSILGEGGMGTVYRAEQTEPVRRTVALKLIKLGMDSEAVVRRFEQERQTLALMDHDGIAKVFDCGMNERGQPFFVMEFVRGVPLTEYCERERLSLPARLRLMQQVCAAVQHAHHKGVVHRDLKPGNVLVGKDGDKIHVKVIDFGLAKAIGPALGDDRVSLFTLAGQALGTPEYMAPEQAGDSADVDTRADIYSLGVMLYEVLVSALPFSSEELRRRGLAEIQRVLREVTPARPSQRLLAMGDGSDSIALARRTSAASLTKALRGDLDWVVLKALEKERARRYASANDIAADLQRYLDVQPLQAGPPSASYRIRKLLRRYRTQAIALAITGVATVAGGIATFAQWQRAEQALDEFELLAASWRFRRADEKRGELYPPWPHKVAALESWLRDDWQPLLRMHGDIESTLRDLRHRAKPIAPLTLEAERTGHEQFDKWIAAGNKLESLRYAAGIRGGQPLAVPKLSERHLAMSPHEINQEAWLRVAPRVGERMVFGQEALALAMARRAVATTKGTPDEHESLDTMAWALIANGQPQEARSWSDRALAAAPPKQLADYRRYRRDVEDAITRAADILHEAESDYAELTAQIHRRRTWEFDATNYLHEALTDVANGMDKLRVHAATIATRLRWARAIDNLTRSHPKAGASWDIVRRELANNPNYAGVDISFEHADVMGLVPIGENPRTGLWEFYDLRSAWDGTSPPESVPVPRHEPDGSIPVTPETGIVFVLLPGGRTQMGSQLEDPNGAFYDPDAHRLDFLHEVSLTPFLIARHELTKGQWARLCTWGTEQRSKSLRVGPSRFGTITLAHPVHDVDWHRCESLLTRHGMQLPTEAQWEYACRAGTTTPHPVPPDRLAENANLADRSTRDAPGYEEHDWQLEAWSDGFAGPAPAGSLRANAFGLFNMLGNVREWCRDWYGSYRQNRTPNGLRIHPPAEDTVDLSRICRGGTYRRPADAARSSRRGDVRPLTRSSDIGVRAARAWRRDQDRR